MRGLSMRVRHDLSTLSSSTALRFEMATCAVCSMRANSGSAITIGTYEGDMRVV